VFYLEDEDDIRKNISYLLQLRGFKVSACAGAAEFYRAFSARPGGVVLLDIGLPGEDGLSVCRYLRAHHPQLGIVFLTALGQRDDRIEGLVAGADAYLAKPFDVDELAVVINRLDARQRAVSEELLMASKALSPLAVPRSSAEDGASLGAGGKASSSSVTLSSEPVQAVGAAVGWRYEAGNGLLRAPDRAVRKLSGHERVVLDCLTSSAGKPVGAEVLARELSIVFDADGKRRVEVIISRLRRNVENDVGQVLPLYLIRGLGYALNGVVRE
jgi:DNA-binding response OmpR family regulator